MSAVMPRGWTLVALAGIAPAFVAGSATPVEIAVALGGMLLAGRALSGFSAGLAALARAAIAWKQVAGFFAAGDAAGREPFLPATAPAPASSRTSRRTSPRAILALVGHGWSYRRISHQLTTCWQRERPLSLSK